MKTANANRLRAPHRLRALLEGGGRMSAPMKEPHVTRLSSGYWMVSWSPNLWIQWKVGHEPTIEDGFGWITDHHVEAAMKAVRPLEGATP